MHDRQQEVEQREPGRRFAVLMPIVHIEDRLAIQVITAVPSGTSLSVSEMAMSVGATKETDELRLAAAVALDPQEHDGNALNGSASASAGSPRSSAGGAQPGIAARTPGEPVSPLIRSEHDQAARQHPAW